MSNARIFRYFKTSPEVIRPAVMTYVRYPPSLRNVGDLLHERDVDIPTSGAEESDYAMLDQPANAASLNQIGLPQTRRGSSASADALPI